MVFKISPGPEIEKVAISPGDKHADTIKAINDNAHEEGSVLISNFHLTDMDVVAALINAKARDAEVQVMIDRNSLGRPHNDEAYSALVNGRVDIMKSSAGFDMSHGKWGVFGKKLLLVGTQNLIREDMASITRDYVVLTADTVYVSDGLRLFAAEVDNAHNGTTNTPPMNGSAWILSPVNSLEGLLALYNSIEEGWDGTEENVGHPLIQQALIAAAKRVAANHASMHAQFRYTESGIKVPLIPMRLIVPKCVTSNEPTRNYEYLYALENAGIQVYVMGNQLYMHAKSDLVNGKTYGIHSQNLSFHSVGEDIDNPNKNKVAVNDDPNKGPVRVREVGFIAEDPAVVAQIQPTFDQDIAAAEPLPAKIPTDCQVLSSKVVR